MGLSTSCSKLQAELLQPFPGCRVRGNWSLWQPPCLELALPLWSHLWASFCWRHEPSLKALNLAATMLDKLKSSMLALQQTLAIMLDKPSSFLFALQWQRWINFTTAPWVNSSLIYQLPPEMSFTTALALSESILDVIPIAPRGK